MTMKPLIPFLCVSVAVHACAFGALAMIMPARTGIAGALDGDPDRVFVCVVSDQDLTPIATTACESDSPAAIESEKIKEQVKPEDRPELLTKQASVAPLERGETDIQEDPNSKSLIAEEEKPRKKEQDDSSASKPQEASNRHMCRAALGKELRDFQSLMLAAIRQATFFPRDALKEKRHGEVMVSFTINRDGKITRVEVVGQSGCAALDDAAKEIIRKASEKFPAFPASVNQDSLAYTLPILFKEKRSGTSSGATAAR
ncbi:energy transducer TonB [Desulfomonile tiedjei]|uniref:TonB family protein n=1 Tax=Desulfomonile tiedjei (strain ATCC 49306 / DSM 6799 / DCB-1) TaxID=706587 RepID=I4CER3_DESTA|nr:energy transducer TonB [Desulfomonile tiedjei]AFM28054.1 TonB family protein [Desulfomonile tiedjei DSM 6799]